MYRIIILNMPTEWTGQFFLKVTQRFLYITLTILYRGQYSIHPTPPLNPRYKHNIEPKIGIQMHLPILYYGNKTDIN